MVARVLLGDCLDHLAAMAPESVDAVVCDPPYGLGFMGMAWDTLDGRTGDGQRRNTSERFDRIGGNHRPANAADQAATRRRENARAQAWHQAWAEAVLRVLKPGGHLVAFGGQRTIHRLACAVEDAGFEIRDMIGWVGYAGFPKSLDVSKAIDAAAGAEREVAGGDYFATAPATDAARQWAGWGTALKPCIESATLARKPFRGTVAAQVLATGTGAINVDGCRYPFGDAAWPGPQEHHEDIRRGRSTLHGPHSGSVETVQMDDGGRWPANLYATPKASRRERERGCDGLPERLVKTYGEYAGSILRCPEHGGTIPSGANGGAYTCGCPRLFGVAEVTGAEAVGRKPGSAGLQSPRAGAGRTAEGVRNSHPTVKPVRLMRWLCRLVTPPGGVVLDPFAGSGSCGVAAVLEGFGYLGMELDPAYHAIAVARIAHAERWPASWADTTPGSDAEADDETEVLERMGQRRLFGGP